MKEYQKSLNVLAELFSKDNMFYFATAKNNVPSVRVIDAYYEDEAFWIVTYTQLNKVIEIESNANAALCHNFYSFKGKAYNVGHPLNEDNKLIREKLTDVFKDWYFLHNDEKDENMCYVKFVPDSGFFYKNGTGYRMDFVDKKVESFPFKSPIEGLEESEV